MKQTSAQSQEIQTVFSFKGETYSIPGFGQDAVSTALKNMKGARVYIMGFLINKVFHPIEL
jgi:hypothetical protein